jgi:hypothetical protein
VERNCILVRGTVNRSPDNRRSALIGIFKNAIKHEGVEESAIYDSADRTNILSIYWRKEPHI